ncbi:MAG: hypothetical protein sL5_02290 [Candidatus Mesenet longicola]|uniref:tRNA (guanine-N(7)-)-methyltransferase n=1 Tax=Candidatus Mesenet longicola TaxID=1892558 RepID=A0A8J3HX75_9RICK|nr:MAG: hypothetical protein sGL2_02280 [Candidatus Mesenet longicola]GHM59236.1 MAG: hypothetical protein sL5_02290 [Candidatus Mesenet longicola]
MHEEIRIIKSFARRSTLKESDKELLDKYVVNNSKEWMEKTIFQKRVWLDIGFGSGENTAAQAIGNQDIIIIGCEPYLKGISSLLKKIEQNNIKNILIWPDDVKKIIINIADCILEKVFILFPDPWQKRAHNKRRLINAEFLKLLAKKMISKGEVIISTDYPEYAKWMQKEIEKSSAFTYTKINENEVENYAETKYHKKAIKEQVIFFKLIYDCQI